MATIGQAATQASAGRGRITLADYESWIDAGEIEDGAPIELFEGGSLVFAVGDEPQRHRDTE